MLCAPGQVRRVTASHESRCQVPNTARSSGRLRERSDEVRARIVAETLRPGVWIGDEGSSVSSWILRASRHGILTANLP